VKTRDSCQPERALEPSASPSSSPCTLGSSSSTADNVEDEVELFVPKRSLKKGKSNKDKLDSSQLQEVMKLIQEAVKNDPTKEMISFLRDEMEKSRKHELKLFQLMLANRTSLGMPPSSSTEVGLYQPWNQGSAHRETGFYPSM